MMYVDLLLPVPLEGLFTYSVPPQMEGAVRFEAKVGIDVNAGTKGSVVFRASTRDPRPLRALLADYALIDPQALRRLAETRDRETCLAVAAMSEALPASGLDPATLTDETAARMREALARYRAIMVRDNPAVDFDELLFIRRKGPSGLVANWQSNSKAPKRGYDNALFRLNVRDPEAAPKEVFRPEGGAFIGDSSPPSARPTAPGTSSSWTSRPDRPARLRAMTPPTSTITTPVTSRMAVSPSPAPH